MLTDADVIETAIGDRRSPWVVVCATLGSDGRPIPVELSGKTVRLSLARDGVDIETSVGSPSIVVEPETAVEVDAKRGVLRVTDLAAREQSPPEGTIVRLSATTMPQGLAAADRYEVAPERDGWFSLRSLVTGEAIRPKTIGAAVKIIVVGAVAYRPSVEAVRLPGELRGTIEILDAEGRATSFPARTGFRARVAAPRG